MHSLAEADLAALDYRMSGGAFDQFNVGAGHTVMEVMHAVEAITGKTVPFKIAPRRECAGSA